jgi:hypothetical protein
MIRKLTLTASIRISIKNGMLARSTVPFGFGGGGLKGMTNWWYWTLLHAQSACYDYSGAILSLKSASYALRFFALLLVACGSYPPMHCCLIIMERLEVVRGLEDI